MTLGNLPWRNWELWRDGGLSEAEIRAALGGSHIRLLDEWLRSAAATLSMPAPDLSTKALVDLATWCVHGTHTLPYEPPDMQRATITRIATQFGVTPELVTSLSIRHLPWSGHWESSAYGCPD